MLSIGDKLLLKRGAEELNVTLDAVAENQFDLYAARLAEANLHLNLTRVPPEKTVTLHFLDSLTLAVALPICSGSRLIDVGTGAGFPGLALAIAYPALSVTLVDATQKRLKFLKAVIAELGIANVRLIHGRAEELGKSHLKGSFDIVTARAVANLERLAAWLIPFVAPGGFAAAYKSESARAEIESSRNAIQRLGGSLERIESVKLPGEEIIRLLAVISVNPFNVAHKNQRRSAAAPRKSTTHKETG